MKKISLLAIFIIWINAHAQSGYEYMERFNAYLAWSQNLPTNPDQNFLNFINNDSPLATKLREQWLYQLAHQHDWLNYKLNYRLSKDTSLQCFAELANYYHGNQEQLLSTARILWLNGNSQPTGCNPLFDILLKSDRFDEHLITQRIILALDKQNIPLIRFLLKQYKKPHNDDEKMLGLISINPFYINQLKDNELQSVFYLYGLKRMIGINIDAATQFWRYPLTQRILTIGQQQIFIRQMALYKAMRNHEDALDWFAMLKPAYYNDALIDWQFRLALKRQDWETVKKLSNHFHDKDNLCWQYWLARAQEATGDVNHAREIYQTIASNRNYYGFLASLRLNQQFAFQNENVIHTPNQLKPYEPFMNKIKSLYHSNHALQASRLLSDFVLELPREDKSALINWLAKDLNWYGKALYLSNDEALSNQLSLRFPLAYQDVIFKLSKNFYTPAELIYAVIRQESGFREDVVSPAGARGLMQLMPATAKQVAKQLRIPFKNKDELFQASRNIHLGVAYLQYLAKRFNNHPLLMAAAYNAGPSQVNYWLKNHPPKEIDIWIETLPWHETRNYLKNIISFYAVYQYRMAHKQNLDDFLKPLA